MRIQTGPISELARQAYLDAGYVDILRTTPNGPFATVEGSEGPFRVIDVGPDWIDAEPV